MSSSDGGSRRSADYDLKRLKWIDPTDPLRFERRPLLRGSEGSNEDTLFRIYDVIDRIFEFLSVFEQSPETSARGASAQRDRRLEIGDAALHLADAETALWAAHDLLQAKSEPYVRGQLQDIGIGPTACDLKINLGAGAHLLEGWVNIDAGGSDLSINVNWGLPFDDQSASFVYCAHLLEHVRYNDQAPVLLSEIHRILAPGGVVRFVVPDLRKLWTAYANRDHAFFEARSEFYPLHPGFDDDGIASLDYLLLFSGAARQTLNYNHKFGYDYSSLRRILLAAGYSDVSESAYQASQHPELRVDEQGRNASAKNRDNLHFSLFVEAVR